MASALILIDIQQGFESPVWGARNNPGAEDNAARLLVAWRKASAPICHIRHISTEPGSPLVGAGAAFKPQVAPQGNEPVFEKHVNSAFIGTDLENHLTHSSIADVVICGLTTPHCVSTTARMAANLGFGVRLAHDACAAFAANASTEWAESLAALTPQVIHDTAISHLHGEFARAMTTDAVLLEGP
ncbi:cysteine hydrolase [Rhodobacteraceae bacterium N5(2021)]|uniref:Cysteine hydrolase n=1 Tax=Gymnodinialimonas phycosphaerae TaxID=2841589 RepID=A0A975YHN0_9RHOB|nr:cysteine hydrolase family protein [Gymnodinialimonas phycosphaerae]MBY4892846.1 cysteine hydrolase [Gymnodinialimonas phycosphaerae]